MAITQKSDDTITLTDGTGTPVTLTLSCTVGDFSADGFAEGAKAVNEYRCPDGTLNSIRKGEHTNVTGSFSVMLDELTDATADTVLDFVLKQGKYSANVSTTDGKGDVYTVDTDLNIVEGGDTRVLHLEDCAYTASISEGDPNTVALSFVCYGDWSMS